MKPQNETEIKVIDFGSSCYEHQRGTLRPVVQLKAFIGRVYSLHAGLLSCSAQSIEAFLRALAKSFGRSNVNNYKPISHGHETS